jgi:hypothetical protein
MLVTEADLLVGALVELESEKFIFRVTDTEANLIRECINSREQNNIDGALFKIASTKQYSQIIKNIHAYYMQVLAVGVVDDTRERCTILFGIIPQEGFVVTRDFTSSYNNLTAKDLKPWIRHVKILVARGDEEKAL